MRFSIALTCLLAQVPLCLLPPTCAHRTMATMACARWHEQKALEHLFNACWHEQQAFEHLFNMACLSLGVATHAHGPTLGLGRPVNGSILASRAFAGAEPTEVQTKEVQTEAFHESLLATTIQKIKLEKAEKVLTCCRERGIRYLFEPENVPNYLVDPNSVMPMTLAKEMFDVLKTKKDYPPDPMDLIVVCVAEEKGCSDRENFENGLIEACGPELDTAMMSRLHGAFGKAIRARADIGHLCFSKSRKCQKAKRNPKPKTSRPNTSRPNTSRPNTSGPMFPFDLVKFAHELF